MRIRIAVLVLAFMWVGASCGGDTVDTKEDSAADDTTTTAEETTTTASSGGEAAAAYFDALATSTPTDNQEAIDASKEGSVARNYAVMQGAIRTASVSSGFTEDDTVEVGDAEIRMCSSTGEDCAVYADIEVDANNKLTDFTINGEDPRRRLSGAGNPVAVAGVTYTPVGAYLAITSDQLFVGYEVQNESGAALSLNTFNESFVDATGQQFSPSQSFGPNADLQPGARTTVVAVFDGATAGGQLAVSGYIEDANFTEAAATLSIPNPGA